MTKSPAAVYALISLLSPPCSWSLNTKNLFTMANNYAPKFVYGKDDALFGSIERQQGDEPFGLVLDAGTGQHSLRWLATLVGENGKGMEKCIAVTADETMQRSCQCEVQHLLGDKSDDVFEIIIGNWFDEKRPIDHEMEMQHVQFDVIISDYLIGAMAGFSDFKQDLMLPKLAKLLKPGGRLYIVGLQPLPDRSTDPDANLICQVRQVRDACILLAGHRCYREYPVDWVQRQIRQEPTLQLLDTSQFSILYRHETIVKQINVARSKFPFFPSPGLANEMAVILDDLEAQTLTATKKRGRIQLGFDYIITAEKVKTETNQENDQRTAKCAATGE